MYGFQLHRSNYVLKRKRGLAFNGLKKKRGGGGRVRQRQRKDRDHLLAAFGAAHSTVHAGQTNLRVGQLSVQRDQTSVI